MLVFEKRGKPEYPDKNLSEQGREPTTNSTHIRRRFRESNPGHIVGGRVLSRLRHPCSPSICEQTMIRWGDLEEKALHVFPHHLNPRCRLRCSSTLAQSNDATTTINKVVRRLTIIFTAAASLIKHAMGSKEGSILQCKLKGKY